MVESPKQRRRRKKERPEPLLGSAAFGADTEGHGLGSEAFGGDDGETPLRGAMAFGNDPQGAPRGAESVGEATETHPLRGSMLFGNDPQGAPRGAESVGEATEAHPLRGAMLFGNDPFGIATGSPAFGSEGAKTKHVGAAAFGSPQGITEKLYRDVIGYDFAGVILEADSTGFAGIRKHPNDGLRKRVLAVLQRHLDVDPKKLRHGLGEHSIKWGKLKNVPTLDRPLAEMLREHYRKAPGEILGIGHVRDILEETSRMHSFVLRCDWEEGSVLLQILWDNESVATAQTRFHKDHRFVAFEDIDGTILGYADRLIPNQGTQTARVRAVDGAVVASVRLDRPGVFEKATKQSQPTRFEVAVLGPKGQLLATLKEMRMTPELFVAQLHDPNTDAIVGRIEDRLSKGKVQVRVAFDLAVPQVLAWALGGIMADLARLRKSGWPTQPDKPDLDEST